MKPFLFPSLLALTTLCGSLLLIFWPTETSSISQDSHPANAQGASKVTKALSELTANHADDASEATQPAAPFTRIKRTHPQLDRIALGETPHTDSRGARRISENRMLQVIDPAKPDLTAQQRVALMKQLSSLSTEEEDTLYAAMLADQLPEGISRSSWNWMVDTMLITLRQHSADTGKMVGQLAQIARTDTLDFTVRDYALQHLGHLKGEGAQPESINPFLTESLSIKDATIAGTSLLALNNNENFDSLSPEQRGEHAQRAATIAADTSYSIESRVTALQVAALHDPSSVEDTATAILSNDSAPSILKLSAQAALNAGKTVK